MEGIEATMAGMPDASKVLLTLAVWVGHRAGRGRLGWA